MAFFSDPFILLMLLMLIAGLGLGVWAMRNQAGQGSLGSRLSSFRAVQSGNEQTGQTGQNAEDMLRRAGRPRSEKLGQLLDALAAFGNTLLRREQEREQYTILLARAGYRYSEGAGLLVALKTLGGVLCLLAVQVGWLDVSNRWSLTGLAATLMAWFIGAQLPEFFVKIRAQRRAEQLARSVPDALDLMVVCAEAGLPLGRIFKVVAREMALSSPIMADEMRYTEAELQLVAERSVALLNFASRTRVPVIESMVASLVQAERYGTPLAQALRTIADESRTTLILQLEERAGKLPAQLSVPLMALILPPIVALMATPALVRVIRMLSQ